MNTIIVDFQNFTLKQNIFVYIDGNCIEQTQTSVDTLSKTIMWLQSKYNINKIDLCGNPDYLMKFKKDLLKDYSQMTVNIISKK